MGGIAPNARWLTTLKKIRPGEDRKQGGGPLRLSSRETCVMVTLAFLHDTASSMIQQSGGTHGEAINQLVHAMQASGIHPTDPGSLCADLLLGGLVRFPCQGERRSNGWAILFFNGWAAGAFGNWKMNISHRWHSGAAPNPPRERFNAAKLRATRMAEELALHEATAARANDYWQSASARCSNNLYLARKSLEGRDLRCRGTTLLVPMYDVDGRLWNVQSIFADGQKRFLRGGRTKGLMWRRGLFASGLDATVIIGEGFATMAAVNAATGIPVAAAFSAANLVAVSEAIAACLPNARLILAADLDASEIGQKSAEAAASAVGGQVVFPPIPSGIEPGKSWDFADTWRQAGGAGAIQTALAALNQQ